MSIIATAVKHLIAAGVTGDALVAAIADMEANMPTSVDEAAERKRAYDRDYQRVRRTNRATSYDSHDKNDIQAKKTPQTPIRNIHTTPSPKGDSPLSDQDTAISEWNDLATEVGLTRVRKLSADRKAKLKRRLAEHGLGGWREALAKIRGSPFCRGENDRGWSANIDFMLAETSFLKLLEGNYDGRLRTDRRNPAFEMAEETRSILEALDSDPGDHSGFGQALPAPVQHHTR